MHRARRRRPDHSPRRRRATGRDRLGHPRRQPQSVRDAVPGGRVHQPGGRAEPHHTSGSGRRGTVERNVHPFDRGVPGVDAVLVQPGQQPGPQLGHRQARAVRERGLRQQHPPVRPRHGVEERRRADPWRPPVHEHGLARTDHRLGDGSRYEHAERGLRHPGRTPGAGRVDHHRRVGILEPAGPHLDVRVAQRGAHRCRCPAPRTPGPATGPTSRRPGPAPRRTRRRAATTPPRPATSRTSPATAPPAAAPRAGAQPRAARTPAPRRTPPVPPRRSPRPAYPHSRVVGHGEGREARRSASASGDLAASPFRADRDRIVASPFFARLGGVTQVVSPSGSGLLVHNRLTHSLKVAQVARAIAERLTADPQPVRAARQARRLRPRRRRGRRAGPRPRAPAVRAPRRAGARPARPGSGSGCPTASRATRRAYRIVTTTDTARAGRHRARPHRRGARGDAEVPVDPARPTPTRTRGDDARRRRGARPAARRAGHRVGQVLRLHHRARRPARRPARRSPAGSRPGSRPSRRR